MAKAETRIVKKIINGLETEFPGIYLRKIHGNPYQHAGIPDIIGCYLGMFIGLEVKTESGKQSTIQKFEGEAISKTNGLYAVVTSLEEAMDVIKGLKFNIRP